MKYFTVNGEPYHCDDIFKFVTVDSGGEVGLHTTNPNLHTTLGFWESLGMFHIQEALETGGGWWGCSCRELT